MRRLLYFALILILALSLAACGSSVDPRYETLLSYLDSGNREAAHAEVDQLLGAPLTMETQPQETQDPVEAASLTWLCTQWFTEEGGNLEFREDGTCTLDGQELTWEIDSVYDAPDCIGFLYREDVSVFNFDAWVEPESETSTLALFPLNEQGNTTGEQTNYYRSAEYTPVEITLDNWQEYFEIAEYAHFQENGFGEVDQFTYYHRIVLKEGLEVNSSLSQVTLEYTCSHDFYKLTIDTEARTYEIGELDKHWSEDTEIRDMGVYYGENDSTWYGVGLPYSPYSMTNQNPTIGFYSVKEVTRIQGTLYLINREP